MYETLCMGCIPEFGIPYRHDSIPRTYRQSHLDTQILSDYRCRHLEDVARQNVSAKGKGQKSYVIAAGTDKKISEEESY